MVAWASTSSSSILVASEPPAVRILRQRRIAHELHHFPSSIRTAQDAANALGVAPSAVYKTLVVSTDAPGDKPLLVMLPGPKDLDPRQLARMLGLKRLRMAGRANAERATGMRTGGISAIPLAGRGFQVFLDHEALALETIYVSAGEPGADVSLSVHDLVELTDATLVDIT